MHPEQIKAAIRMTGTTPAVLADELGVSRSTVSHVINGRGTSARVKSKIASVTGLSISTLWPTQVKLRRPKVERDSYGFPLDAVPFGKPFIAAKAATAA
jgi:lambda repressor-like predicted transcriptional regulator